MKNYSRLENHNFSRKCEGFNCLVLHMYATVIIWESIYLTISPFLVVLSDNIKNTIWLNSDQWYLSRLLLVLMMDISEWFAHRLMMFSHINLWNNIYIFIIRWLWHQSVNTLLFRLSWCDNLVLMWSNRLSLSGYILPCFIYLNHVSRLYGILAFKDGQLLV